ncbi:enoyl-CoA hydratase [Pseudooceanicola sp. 216_PA32_1]|jgi:enoyl-CoA hydratase|uniref:Enoyl-CoA hydratase n=1 Tax=Pseudooceanicola pacificus TaxID=2676438 RepID=A0A844W7Y1_9RHOB|nr:enoyl-CoA hydratase [Pseudooceanicola pacificus]MWB76548.1 enoyl-CoA hydratase [Pseudooceanicola pacificus]
MDAETRDDRAYAIKEGSIGWLVFQNPTKLNAISGPMVEDAIAIARDFAADPEIRTVILRGAGEKAFISGGDISKFEKTRFSPQGQKEGRRALDILRAELIEMDKPVIAMIHGYCLGGGMGVALCADMRFGAETSQLGIPAALRGVAYPISGLKLLVDLVGPSIAKDIMISGRRLKAEEALRVGLLNRVVPADELEDVTRAYAQTIADNAPLSIRASKFFINQLGLEEDQRDTARIEDMVIAARDSEDFKESTRAFMEKRKPVFKGR